MASTLKNVIYFFSAGVLAKFVGLFRSFITAKILQPSDYGIWITLLLVISFAPIFSFGTGETLLKKVPYYLGKGEIDKAGEIEKGVLCSVLISAILLLMIGFSFNFFITNKTIEALLPLVHLTLVTAAISFFSAYFYHRFTAHQYFKIVSIIDTFRSATAFLIVISCLLLWGLKGAVIGIFLDELTILLFSFVLNSKLIGKIGVIFKAKLIWELVRVGFPITLLWWIFIIQSSADRMISMSMLGKTATGYYGLGVAIVSMVVLLPQAVGRVLYPKVSEEIGKSSSPTKIFSLVIKPTRALCLLLPLMIGCLMLISPVVFIKLLPQYHYGLASAQILLLGSFFICLIRTGANYLIAKDRQNILLAYFFISLIANIIGNITLINLGLNIEGIAISTSCSGALLTSLVWASVFKDMGYGKYEQIKKLFELYLPFMALLTIFAILLFILPNFLKESTPFFILHGFIFIFAFLSVMLAIPPLNTWWKELVVLFKLNLNAIIAKFQRTNP